jgi:transposase
MARRRHWRSGRIVLAAADGLNNKEIAVKVGICAATAGTWRNRFGGDSKHQNLFLEGISVYGYQ